MTMTNEAKIERAQELYRQGMTREKISEEIGMSVISVRRYIRMMPDYEGPALVPNFHWTMERQTEFMWQWPVAVNLIRRRCGMDPLPVPEHDHDDEIRWLTPIKKTKRSRRTL